MRRALPLPGPSFKHLLSGGCSLWIMIQTSRIGAWQQKMAKKDPKDFPSFREANLFSDAPSQGSLFAPVTPQPAPKAGFPSLSLSHGFSRSRAKSDAMLTLRILSNQAAKALQTSSPGFSQKATFLASVEREIKLKTGIVEAEMEMRDALLGRFCDKG